VWARPLEDGTMAVGLFNRAPEAMRVTVKFADIGLPRMSPIRFPWTHTDQGGVAGSGDEFGATVPRHGVVLMKVGRAKKG
jgi:alpha-galactosidase